MDNSLAKLERELRLFRPLGEARLIERALAELAQQAATDTHLRARLAAAPLEVLAELGVPTGLDLHIEVHEAVPGVVDLVLRVSDEVGADVPPALLPLLQRVRHDPKLAQALHSDARGTVQAALGIGLPADVDIRVHQNTVQRQHLVLPAGATCNAELSDAELDMVAGGVTVPNVFHFPWPLNGREQP